MTNRKINEEMKDENLEGVYLWKVLFNNFFCTFHIWNSIWTNAWTCHDKLISDYRETNNYPPEAIVLYRFERQKTGKVKLIEKERYTIGKKDNPLFLIG